TTDRPNILWLTSEDNNITWVGCYGNPYADTPNIDQLAKDGFQYMNTFANAPVCAPSRSTWITGMLAVSMGTHHMRSRYDIPHDRIRYYPDLLAENGYYIVNGGKTDYNIGGRDDRDCWEGTKKLDWNALKENQPFFQIINHTESHESKAFGDVSNTQHDPQDVTLKSYHPDVLRMRQNYAHYHDAVKRMDTRIGEALQQLEANGLAENTIVVYVSDHGGVLPRSKRFLFQSGIHCPLIVRIPEKYQHLYPAEAPGAQVEEIVSFVDMPKTWLSLTGSEIPDTMQGRVFLGEGKEAERNYHFAFRGRMDERVDNARAITDGRYLYIRNYMPYVPWMQRLGYLWKMEATQAWEAAYKAGAANEVQAKFFAPKGAVEELYDMQSDSDNVNNLADSPEYAEVIETMRAELRSQQLKHVDAGLIPESEMVQLTQKTGLTPYEIARDSSLYNLPALLDAADLALAQDESNIAALEALLESPDAGLRYWGMVG
ncbi:MAG: sulfatase family protein, partial [Coraliomargarita sp.]